MAKVGILMGSDSDLPVMKKAADMLEKFGIEYEMTIISAHRMPDVFVDYATKAEERGVEVIIADIEKLKMQEQPPAFEKQKICGKCAYHDLCFI